MHEAARTPLRVCVFKGLQNLPLYVATQQGFLERQGLDVEILYTPGSTLQLTGLIHGAYHLIQTAPDNVVNACSDPEAFGLDPAQPPRVVMLLGGSVGPLHLYAQPGITTFAGLHGASLGVDHPGSGFALLLRDMLARHDLLLDRDYLFTVAGGTSARLDALRTRKVAATLLYAPFDAMAERENFSLLATSTDYYAAYASLATAALQSWLTSHQAEVKRYIAAILLALNWIYDPAHAESLQTLLVQEPALAVPSELAAHACAAFVDPLTGFGRDAQLSEAGLEQVIALRTAYGNPDHAPGPVASYIDLSYYTQAQRSL